MDIDRTTELMKKVLEEGLGLDLQDPNLQDTPGRIARMWVNEFLSSKECSEGFCNLTAFPNEDGYDQIIVLDRIHFVSMCSHHFLPFSGLAWLAYIPGKLLAGASKPSRLIQFHSRKPQLQERLVHEVISEFDRTLAPQGTYLLMRGVHGCMSHRGALQYGGAGMTTSACSGVFRSDLKAKMEALDLVKISLNFPNV